MFFEIKVVGGKAVAFQFNLGFLSQLLEDDGVDQEMRFSRGFVKARLRCWRQRPSHSSPAFYARATKASGFRPPPTRQWPSTAPICGTLICLAGSASSMKTQAFGIKPAASNIKHQASSTNRQASKIQYQASKTKHRTSNIIH